MVSGPPRKNHKNIGFLCNTGPDPLTITRLPSQHSMLGHHRHASETPFNVFGSSLALIKKKKTKKNTKKLSVTKLSGSAHGEYIVTVLPPSDKPLSQPSASASEVTKN